MRLIFALLALFASPALAGVEETRVDLELVLAVDVSRSMDRDELVLQREGYAAALEHPAVASALMAGELGRVAFMYFEWGGPGRHRVLVDWMVIETAEDAGRAARMLRHAPIRGLQGTSISGAMDTARAAFASNGFAGTRQVLDISGDGPNSTGRPVLMARADLAAAGIEVNGLPFMVKQPKGVFSIPDLDFYYEDCVILGESSFVIPIARMDRLVGSIRQKLVMEIAGLQPERPARIRRASISDCMVGEKQRDSWRSP